MGSFIDRRDLIRSLSIPFREKSALLGIMDAGPHYCALSQPDLASLIGTSARTLRRSLTCLEESGLITVSKSGRTSCIMIDWSAVEYTKNTEQFGHSDRPNWPLRSAKLTTQSGQIDHSDRPNWPLPLDSKGKEEKERHLSPSLPLAGDITRFDEREAASLKSKTERADQLVRDFYADRQKLLPSVANLDRDRQLVLAFLDQHGDAIVSIAMKRLPAKLIGPLADREYVHGCEIQLRQCVDWAINQAKLQKEVAKARRDELTKRERQAAEEQLDRNAWTWFGDLPIDEQRRLNSLALKRAGPTAERFTGLAKPFLLAAIKEAMQLEGVETS